MTQLTLLNDPVDLYEWQVDLMNAQLEFDNLPG